MKITTILMIAAALFLSLSSTVSAQESINDFTLVNNTGYVISEVYISPTALNEWGEDVMDVDVLGIDESVNIKFSPRSYEGLWDIKVVYSIDNSEVVWSGYDLTSILSITIHYDALQNVTSAEVEEVE